jgi:hypothetical protein
MADTCKALGLGTSSTSSVIVAKATSTTAATVASTAATAAVASTTAKSGGMETVANIGFEAGLLVVGAMALAF